MKEKLALIFIIFIISISFLSCKKQEILPKSQEISNLKKPIVYENKSYGFSLNLPKEWKNSYLVIQKELKREVGKHIVIEFLFDDEKLQEKSEANILNIEIFDFENFDSLKDHIDLKIIKKTKNWVYTYKINNKNPFESDLENKDKKIKWDKMVLTEQNVVKNFKLLGN